MRKKQPRMQIILVYLIMIIYFFTNCMSEPQNQNLC